MRDILNPSHIVAAVLYSGVGLAVFFAAFALFDKVTPYKLWDEIVQKQNRALATVIGAISVGISIVIAAAISG